MTAIANLPGYQIVEELYAGTRTIVYRGIRIRDHHPIVIKILRNEYPNFTELLQFRNQYTIGKNLNFPSIIQLLSLEPYQHTYALIMEDFGGISLATYLKTVINKAQSSPAVPLAEFLQIACQLTDILHYLYQNRVIHKDIKPANILINPDTKQIKLIDFSIASLLPRETQEIQNPNVLEGTLAYLSPEQTGRMNRGIDYRSDFYSLGMTFYELLTGELPFVSEDGMELVHCHLAKQAIPIDQINPDIPVVLSAIVSKLMAKNAEDRYQSALGLKHDLEICLVQLQDTGKIETFEIGQRDTSDRFIIPEKLYGREKEVAQLLDAFIRVASPQETKTNTGNTEMILVAGFSGIGKTAVINEVHKPIVRQRGYFIKGKYDQFQRNIPFSAFVQAFRDLMGQLLSESDLQIETSKTKILTALGDNGQVLIDVIPELEEIIGKHPPATELSGTAAKNRFNLLFQKFVQVFTSIEHPLVMFLDDLQWADSASLNLLQLLMQDTKHLLILGAYRDNEVSPVHPLILTINEIIKTGITVNTITLSPLREIDLNQLVADTLNCELLLAKVLTKLIYQKTQGNPFFATQFLKALYNDEIISYDWKICNWQCDIAKIKALAITDDVVEFMALQLQKLQPETQNILKLAACIGAEFDLHTLAIISEQSVGKTAITLWKALQEGLVIPTARIYKFFAQADNEEVFQTSANPTYRFLHDRVQQAAYSLIAPAEKQTTHFYIGKLLLQNLSRSEREERIFEIVNHLNIGKELITEASEQKELAELNLLAGIKAKAATAYAGAFAYITAGMELLSPDCWEQDYHLSLSFFKERAELEYLTSNFEQAERWLLQALEKAKLPLEKAEIYNMAIVQYTMQAKYPEAIQAGRQALVLVSIYLPEEDFDTVCNTELALIQETLKNRSFSDLCDLPIMTQPEQKIAIKLLISMGPPTYRSHQRLWSVICAKAVNLCLQYGNTPEIGYIYPAFGGLRGYALNNYQDTEKLLDVTLQLMPVFNNKSAESVAYLMIGSSLRHWSHPLKIATQDYLLSYQAGLDSSNLQYAAYAFGHNMYCRFYQSIFLEQLFEEIAESLVFSQKYKNQWAIDLFLGGQIVLAEYIGIAVNLSESDYLEQCRQHKNWQVICIYNILKSQLLFVNEQWEEAFKYGAQAESEIVNVAPQGLLIYVYHCFIYALLLIARYPNLPQEQQLSCWAKIAIYQQQMEVWAAKNPVNFLHLCCLVKAEMDRVAGDFLKAIDNYDRAIAGAKESKHIQEEAIANELAAKFYLGWGKEKVAQVYMTEAYYCYVRWGAKTKVEDLEKRYPQLLSFVLQQPHAVDSLKETIAPRTIASSQTSSSILAGLDLDILLKASQAISGEIELERLLATLLEIVITNAGASKCILLLQQDLQLKVVALVKEGKLPEILPFIPLESSPDVALSLVNTVKRTLKPLVLADARINSQFAADSYIQNHQPKSVLCSPILSQGQLIGVLYLENNLTVGAFTSDRVELLNLLCVQAAISLQNAQLYQNSQNYAQQLTQSVAQLQANEIRFQNLANNIPGMVYQFRTGADGAISTPYVSSGCLDLYEVEPELVMAGKFSLYALHHPDDNPAIEKAIAYSAQHLTPFAQEWRIILPSGKVKWIQSAARPEQQADGAILWDGVVIDISDRKQIEAEQTRLLAILESTSDLIGTADPSGRNLYLNQAWRNLLGIEDGAAEKGNKIAKYHPDWATEIIANQGIPEAIRAGIWVGETAALDRDGREIPVSQLILAHKSPDGELEYFSTILRDISDLKQAELAIRQKSQEAEQAQLQMIQSEKMSALGNLVAGIAHEMNNPLGFISASLKQAQPTLVDLIAHLRLYQQSFPHPSHEILDHAEEIDLEYSLEDLPKMVNGMEMACDRLKNISTSLRTFSRADKDYKVSFNIHEGIDSTILILKHRLKANEHRPAIEVITEYGKIPKIECFPGQLNQVFMNILANAIDALDESNVGRSFAEINANPNRITITTSVENQSVKISIADNGRGMSEEVKQKIFEHLFTTKGVGKGTGLGLAIARQIIEEKHQGSIVVNSEIGAGTEFIIYL